MGLSFVSYHAAPTICKTNIILAWNKGNVLNNKVYHESTCIGGIFLREKNDILQALLEEISLALQ